MNPFSGFFPEKEPHINIPNSFFEQLLPAIQNINELKITLYFLWHFERTEAVAPFLLREEIISDTAFFSGLGESHQESLKVLDEGLALAINRGSILTTRFTRNQEQIILFFLNTPRNRATVDAINQGAWHHLSLDNILKKIRSETPTIFQLYEENIGPITPLLSEALKDLEYKYPIDLIEEAIREAVKYNKRNLKYIGAILSNWQEVGKNVRTNRKSGKAIDKEYDPEKYTGGEYSDIIES